MTRTTNIKKFLGVGVFIGLFVFIVFYAFFQTRSLARGVDLVVKGISDGAIFEGNILNLTGQATHAKHIRINDREILVDKDNNFSDELVLSPGYNIITIEAEDKYDKKTEASYRVFYKEDSSKATALNN